MSGVFSAEPVLARLKDFQRRTVEHAFGRMFSGPDPARRFLVADEVGLGKTLVAQGLIAKTVEHLQGEVSRIDVIYICSNADIAAQNVSRLNVTGGDAFVEATRLTLLPLKVSKLQGNSINFISFTPGTTFNHGRNAGRKEERQLIYKMLESMPGLRARGLARVLQGRVGKYWLDAVGGELEFDQTIAADFRNKLAASEMFGPLAEMAELLSDYRRKMSEEQQDYARRLTGDIRRLLARCCLDALKPSLVILDEFQRFRDLLVPLDANEEDEPISSAAELANELFNHAKNPRVLLLSATPYKMYAAHHEGENHYQDFLQTTRFLFDDPVQVEDLARELHRFREMILASDSNDLDMEDAEQAKRLVERRLKRVMCRTERVGATAGLDAMVVERREVPSLAVEDILDFKAVDSLGRAMGAQDALEYWRSSPYLLNFMKDYDLKRRLRDHHNLEAAREAIEGASGYRLLPADDLRSYRTVDPANARLRTLMADVDGHGAWRLLWVPPSLPYWTPAGPFKDAAGFTKTLVFSAWNMVPDAIAGLLSYRAERLAVAASGRRLKYEGLGDQLRPRLRFPALADGTVPGMNALALLYPSRTLADLIDPLAIRAAAPLVMDLAEVRRQARMAVASRLSEIDLSPDEPLGPPDRRWYWVALARLDACFHPGMRDWCDLHWAVTRQEDGSEASDTGFRIHVDQWLRAWDGESIGLGPIPNDLGDVLADMALAGVAVAAFRSLRRVSAAGTDPVTLCSASVRIADGLRRQFNSPDAILAIEQGDADEAYWQRVLHYCVEGNLQALFDEYVHLLHEAKSGQIRDAAEIAKAISDIVFDAASIRSTPLHPDYPVIENGRVSMDPTPVSLRCRYAVRYGDAREEDGAVSRKETVRAAFNSPFRPFVLASTSVGQEGLDFHAWCHSFVHWNLPGNPVDMEQREGRVHRYKGHAVRKNVALSSSAAIADAYGNPWLKMFEHAHQMRPEGANDLVPFWIHEPPGGTKVQRRVFATPLSQDEQRLAKVKSSLALYRMVFGQPRQDDLLSHLVARFDTETAENIVMRWRIDLSPGPVDGGQDD